jgi:hypothetical protein
MFKSRRALESSIFPKLELKNTFIKNKMECFLVAFEVLKILHKGKFSFFLGDFPDFTVNIHCRTFLICNIIFLAILSS